MKKYMILACTMVCLSIFANDAIHLRKTSSEDVRIVNFCDLTENDLKEIVQGLHPDKIIAFLANTTLPISCHCKGDLIHLVQNEEKWGAIEIKQTFYAKCANEEFLFSSDLTEWKHVLEFITGDASVALGIQDGQTSLVIGTEISKRL
ncbi:MAG: hypothetical protein C5B45_02920 [Chlamydiae bacterium]|nr:MAG: hypothetical protein C5B45_02920 [Chlamydiota bacterium]